MRKEPTLAEKELKRAVDRAIRDTECLKDAERYVSGYKESLLESEKTVAYWQRIVNLEKNA